MRTVFFILASYFGRREVEGTQPIRDWQRAKTRLVNLSDDHFPITLLAACVVGLPNLRFERGLEHKCTRSNSTAGDRAR